jgi:hypothetical protein
MRIGVNLCQYSLLSVLAALPECRAQEEELIIRKVFQARKLWVGLSSLAFFPGLVRGHQSARVRDIFTQSELSVDVDRLVVKPRDGILLELLHKAVRLVVEVLLGGLVPPFVQDSVHVELGALVVEAMRQLVADHHAPGPVRDVLRYLGAEDGLAHNAGREDDLVVVRAVVRVDGRRGHGPARLVDRLEQLVPRLVRVELGLQIAILMPGRARSYDQLGVVLSDVGRINDIRPLRLVANLLDNVGNYNKLVQWSSSYVIIRIPFLMARCLTSSVIQSSFWIRFVKTLFKSLTI